MKSTTLVVHASLWGRQHGQFGTEQPAYWRRKKALGRRCARKKKTLSKGRTGVASEGGAMKSEGVAQTAVEDMDGSESEGEREREPCGEGHMGGGVMLKVEVPIRGIDEWVLWRFLERMFGDENFSVVVSFFFFL